MATTAPRYGSKRVRRGKVRVIAVTSPKVAKNRKLLRRYLKLAGV